MEANHDKAAKSEHAAEAALKLIDKHGLDRLTIAQVARLAKVSRPWIYKYIGNNQKDLIEFAVDHFGRILSSLDQRSNPKNPKEWIASTLEGTSFLLDLAEARPWLITLYYRYRGTQTVVGKRTAEIEALYMKVFSREIQESLGFGATYSAFLASSLSAVRMGLAHQWITSPKSPKQKEVLLKLVEAVLMRMVEA